ERLGRRDEAPVARERREERPEPRPLAAPPLAVAERALARPMVEHLDVVAVEAERPVDARRVVRAELVEELRLRQLAEHVPLPALDRPRRVPGARDPRPARALEPRRAVARRLGPAVDARGVLPLRDDRVVAGVAVERHEARGVRLLVQVA